MERCVICGWSLAKSADQGCVVGDCSFRCDNPTEWNRIKDRRAKFERVTKAVMETWAAHGEVPFPLYEQEAKNIAAAAITAFEMNT